ncbi:HNH endonuclease signature motif containing protein [Dokdonella ginsengisoli]|uniref:HNH endonuclease signature motif containing protein n=1 Tax=Dokdonella ginsengisoli TaxID=363846 RepID=A0ABV9R357_9GAMM
MARRCLVRVMTIKKSRRCFRWSDLDRKLLRELYNDANNRVLAVVLGRSLKQVESEAARMGLRKNRTCLRKYCHPGKFKQGHPGVHAREIGEERLQGGWRMTKVAEEPGAHRRNWRRSHILVWEQANGCVPQGHVLAFRDGDRSHIHLDNIELVAKSEALRRNLFSHYPPELWDAMQGLRQLRRAIQERRDEKQDARSSQSSFRNDRSGPGPRRANGHRQGARSR